ncbi:MAG: hypothetical protein OEV78_00990 [Spirochaetia bacterium]|nr:hypothetical protein [Spirochaetia bacterium]
MKVKTNWLESNNIVGDKNGIFENKGADVKNKQLKAEFYIIKKQKKASENFSMMLINEFNGLRITDSRNKSIKSFLDKNKKEESTSNNKSVSESDLKAVNFLNGYWA